jgi:uncharacterized protein YbjT (DUF2867 family)
VRGDLTVPESLDSCLQEIDTVFLVWVAPPEAIAGAVERIAKHARRIVYLTAPLKTPHPFFQQPNPSRAIAERVERLVEQSGLDWTFVRAGMFAGNARHFWGPQIRAGGVIRWPYLDSPTAPTDERDIATIVVRALCDSGHAGSEYVVTGPQSLTQAEQIQTIGRAIGRVLRVEEMTPDEARSELLPVLGSPVFIDMLLNAWGAALGQPAFVSSTFAELAGRASRPFLEWATDYAAEFRV